VRTAGIGAGRIQRRGTQGDGAGEEGDGGGVEGLDRRREPGNELPDEDGGDGRMRDAAGGGWEDFEGSGRGAATRFEIHGGGLEEPKEEGGGEDGRGKKRRRGKENLPRAAVGGSGME
jgi:hypothetical protein